MLLLLFLTNSSVFCLWDSDIARCAAASVALKLEIVVVQDPELTDKFV
jgi:hypothetical protein